MFVTTRQEPSGKMTAGRIAVDYLGLEKQAPKTAKTFSALPSYEQHTALSVCPHPVKQEHHRKMYSSRWDSIRNYDFNSDPNSFFLSLSSLCVICTTFLHAQGTHVCKIQKICDKLLTFNEEEKMQLLFKKPLHINSSILCTGNLGLVYKKQTVSSECELSSTCVHWYEVFWAIPLILATLYKVNALA